MVEEEKEAEEEKVEAEAERDLLRTKKEVSTPFFWLEPELNLKPSREFSHHTAITQ